MPLRAFGFFNARVGTRRPKSNQSGGMVLPPVQKLVATLQCAFGTSATSPISRTFYLQTVGESLRFQTHPVRMWMESEYVRFRKTVGITCFFKMSYKNTHTMTDTVMDTIAVVDSTMLQVCGLFRISRILHIVMIQLRHCGKITLVFLFKRVYDIENKYRGACVSRLRGSNRTSTLNLMRIMPP